MTLLTNWKEESISSYTAQLTVPLESTAQQLSFEWSEIKISSKDSREVRTTLYSKMNSTTAKVLLNSFQSDENILEFHPQTQKNHLVQQNEPEYHSNSTAQ